MCVLVLAEADRKREVRRSVIDGGSWGPAGAVLDPVRTGHGVHWTGAEVEEEMDPRVPLFCFL